MKKALVSVILFSAVLLPGCIFQSFFDHLFPGIPDDGPAAFSSAVVTYGFQAQVVHEGVDETRNLAVEFASIAPILYTAALDDYQSHSPVDDLPYVYISFRLDPTGTTMQYLGAWRRIQYYDNGVLWERRDQITAEDIPLHREVNGNKYFRVDASHSPEWARLIYVEYRDWHVGTASQADPNYRIKDPYLVQGDFGADSDRYIEIELRQ